MQRFAVIGLGRFGGRLAMNLASAGQEVIAIDRDRQLIEEMRDRVTLAIALDATDEEALRMQGIDKVDVAVVSVGNDFEATALATVVLKQLGVPRVISRAVTPMGARILSRIGADEVVNPEDESADRWATRLASPHFLKQHELDAGHSIVEIKAPAQWVGKTLAELSLRSKLGVHVVAIRRAVAAGGKTAASASHLHMPMPNQPLAADDVLLLMGSDEQLAAIPSGE